MNPDTPAAGGLTSLDWAVIVAYLATVLGIGVVFARRASRHAAGYLLAGRSLPWWVAGTSIVATTFSSDTPLQVVALVRSGGIGENWWWWSMAAGQVVGVFLFAPLWRRSRLVTDVGFIGLRYEGRSGTTLRVVEGLWQGLLVNGGILASVTIGMATIVRVMFDLDADSTFAIGTWSIDATTAIVAVLAIATVGYSTLSGLYGVAWSDLLQFILATVGSIWLAISVVGELGGPAAMIERIAITPHAPPDATSLAPDLSNGAAIATVVTFFTLNWWSRAPGHGALAQRLLASRNPREGALAMAWFVVAHHVLRPWPWILVALASIVLVPTIVDPATGRAESLVTDQEVFPWMIRHHLGPGLRGLLVVAMLGAFMSTVDTHVNLSSAYLLDDVVEPCRKAWRRNASTTTPTRCDDDEAEDPEGGRRRVRLARLLALPVLGLVLMAAGGIGDIVAIYKYLGVIAAGMAPVMILRWYWWRITAWTEIAGMVVSLVAGHLLTSIGPLAPPAEGPDVLFGPRLATTMILSAAVWLPVTFLSRPVSRSRLVEFERRIRPGGPGWSMIRRQAAAPGSGPPPPGGPAPRLAPRLAWSALGTIATWTAITGLGHLVLGRPFLGLPLLAASIAVGIPVVRAAARLASEPEPRS